MLLGIVVAVFGMGLVGALDNFNFNRANVRIAQETHVAMARMSRELQELLPLYDAANNINGIVGGANFIIYERAADAPRSGQSPTVRYALVHPAGTSRILLYTGLGFQRSPNQRPARRRRRHPYRQCERLHPFLISTAVIPGPKRIPSGSFPPSVSA